MKDREREEGLVTHSETVGWLCVCACVRGRIVCVGALCVCVCIHFSINHNSACFHLPKYFHPSNIPNSFTFPQIFLFS